MYKAVFLDRDGVLNKAIVKNGKPFPPQSLNELIIAPDALESLLKLKSAGFLLFCVTNQPDVARGTTAKSTVEEINLKILNTLPIDDMFVCYHDEDDNCECRKPKPGLILDAARKYNIDTKKSFMIGDRWRDIDAGNSANCKTIWINCNYKEKQPTQMHLTTNTLMRACEWIIEKRQS